MKLGFIGAGNMGGAIIRGYVKANPDQASNVYISEYSPEFAKKVERRYKSEKDNTVLWARSYKGSVEVVLKRPYGVEIFSYNKGDININSLTTSEITEIYQSL